MIVLHNRIMIKPTILWSEWKYNCDNKTDTSNVYKENIVRKYDRNK